MADGFRGFVYYKGHPGVTKKMFNEESSKTYKETVEHWHEKFLPQHFEAGNRSRYPGEFPRRTKGHEIRKRKTKGHNIPLVFSGDLRDEATKSIEVKSSQKGATGKFNIPRYAYVLYSTGIDMVDEMTVTNDAEMDEMATLVDKLINDKILKPSGEKIETKEV